MTDPIFTTTSVYVLTRNFHASYDEGNVFDIFGVYANLEDAKAAAENYAGRDSLKDDFTPYVDGYKQSIEDQGWDEEGMSYILNGEHDTVSYDIEPFEVWQSAKVER